MWTYTYVCFIYLYIINKSFFFKAIPFSDLSSEVISFFRDMSLEVPLFKSKWNALSFYISESILVLLSLLRVPLLHHTRLMLNLKILSSCLYIPLLLLRGCRQFICSSFVGDPSSLCQFLRSYFWISVFLWQMCIIMDSFQFILLDRYYWSFVYSYRLPALEIPSY